MKDLIAISYLIKWDEQRLLETTLTCTKYDAEDAPIAWVIRQGDCAMSKNDGQFYPEPRPSSRTAKYLDEFRFKDKSRAVRYYRKFHKD